MKVVYFLRGVVALLVSVVLTVCTSSFPGVPHEKKLELVWADEFEDETLDLTKWSGLNCNDDTKNPAVRRGSYWHTDMATVQDGSLHIQTKYFANGYKNNGKPGWYSCGIDTADLYEQTYGYFETRCILPKGVGLWAAFWMSSPGIHSVDGTGTDGAEIDIMEAPYYAKRLNRMVTSNIHFDGYEDAHQSKKACNSYIFINDPYEKFNTYGVEWNEKGYTFYVNGIKTGHSDFGGACAVPEYLILSVEVGGENAVPAESWAGDALAQDAEVSDFIVDYVRAYQYK